tara:strand:- start:1021 stop:2583 length:1563 start_codon:yes stop_codon:yes gene_type:complete
VFINSNNIENNTTDYSDVCVIGSGPAGIAIANKLISKNISVTLLESGGLEGETYTQDLNSGEMLGQDPGYDLEMSRLRLFGGTSNHWEGSNQRLDKIDFKSRNWIPFSGWPINIKELDKYYKEATLINEVPNLIETKYEYYKDDNIIKYIKLFKEKYNSEIDIVTNHINPLRFGEKYYLKFKKNNTLKVFLHATALRLNLDDQKEIKSIEASTNSNKKLLLKSKYFVLAMGGIENARFLLLNLSKIPYESINNRPIIGSFFQEHYGFTAGTLLLNQKVSKLLDIEKTVTMNSKLETETYLVPSELTQENEKILNCRITLYKKNWNSLFGPYDLDKNTLKYNFRSYLNDYISSMKGPYEWISANKKVNNIPQRVYIGLEQSPNPNSRVSLINKLDNFGQRKAALDWRLNEIDELSIKNITKWFANSIGANALGRMKIDNDIYNINRENLNSSISGGYHHMGTTRMGSNMNSSVVDKNSKYHQIDNLFIAGSSVFPTSGSTNPTFTIVALATRLAEHIITKF